MGREPIVYRLSEMSGYEFEDAVETLFRRLGYRAEVSERVSDMGRDIIARSDSETIIVECKHTSSSIGRPIVQKLHSSTVSFSEDATGMIVTTSTFSRPAREHAEKLGDEIQLWDYRRLVEKGREVDLYFVSEEKGTELVFRPRTLSGEQVVEDASNRLKRRLESSPRDIASVLKVDYAGAEWVPALIVDYEVDETFGTSTYPNLHRANERGRSIYRLDDGQLSATEEEVWKAASFRDQRTEPIDGRPPESLFGVDVTGYEDDLKRRVATRHSTTVSYRGRNNQVYSKECRVEPDDVKVTTRQVLLSYPNLDFEVGPTRYACRLTGSADVEPHVVAARGIDPNDLDRIWQGRSAYLCNDCAQITPTDAEPSPAACGDCGRTLCASHHWRFPNKAPQSWVDRCASCYREEAQTDPTLGDFPIGGYAATVFSGLIPGLSFFAGGRFAIGTFFSLLAAGTIAAPLVLGWSVQESAPFGIGLGAICLWSLLATLVWANRLRRHRQNLVELEGYTPEWRSQE